MHTWKGDRSAKSLRMVLPINEFMMMSQWGWMRKSLLAKKLCLPNSMREKMLKPFIEISSHFTSVAQNDATQKATRIVHLIGTSSQRQAFLSSFFVLFLCPLPKWILKLTNFSPAAPRSLIYIAALKSVNSRLAGSTINKILRRSQWKVRHKSFSEGKTQQLFNIYIQLLISEKLFTRGISSRFSLFYASFRFFLSSCLSKSGTCGGCTEEFRFLGPKYYFV